ncbi:MAG TPA: hypothetical protein PKE32_07845, partial [Miltoncostaeaceae bacterium]|nr:hypothetical protein [Miltoncostaeaceae bacterium]
MALALALGATLAVAGGAHGESLAYIDNGNIWVSSLDGTQKHQLTTDGEWDEVAQSDNGRIAGVRREGSKVPQLNTLKVWEKTGSEAFTGWLPKYGTSWSMYVYPLSFDLSADGRYLAWGYQNVRYNVYPTPNTLRYGIGVVQALTPTYLDQPDPYGPDYRWPTIAGDRIVANDGSKIWVQNPGPGNPVGSLTYAPWLDASGVPDLDQVHRTDVAANGKMVAIEYVLGSGAAQLNRIGVLQVTELGGSIVPGGVDCVLSGTG